MKYTVLVLMLAGCDPSQAFEDGTNIGKGSGVLVQNAICLLFCTSTVSVIGGDTAQGGNTGGSKANTQTATTNAAGAS